MSIRSVVVLFVVVLACSIATAKSTVVPEFIYPRSQSEQDSRFHYLVELLELALAATEKEFGPYVCKPSAVKMSEVRYINELKKERHLTVGWYSTSEALEGSLLPIRIPLRKGVLGYRLFLIDKANQKMFDQVKTIEDLRVFRVGQGFDWGDVKVFKGNKLPVVTGHDYEALFTMLMAGRFDYFSRGINEAPSELAERKDKFPDMAIEESLLLFYPWPYYFFVSKDKPHLARRLETGLKRLQANGKFDKIFYKYHGDTILKANLHKRRLIKIDNPLLPDKTPTDDKRLWLDPYATPKPNTNTK